MRTNDADTMNSPFAIRDDFHKTLGPTLGLRTIVLGERPAQDTDIHPVDLSLPSGRHWQVRGPQQLLLNSSVSASQLEKRIANDDACVIPGNMGNRSTSDIANGEDPLVRGPQPRIDLYALR